MSARWTLLALGLSFRTAPVSLRERLAFRTAEMAEGFFDPGAVHHMHAAKFQADILTGLPKGFENMAGHIS